MSLPGRALWDGNVVRYDFSGAPGNGVNNNFVLGRNPALGALNDYLMPADGWVVGIVSELPVANAGNGRVTISASGKAVSPVVNVGSLQQRGSQPVSNKYTNPIRKGALLGAQVTTDGGWAAGTIGVSVYVGFDRISESG